MEADPILDFYFLDSSNGARPDWHKEPNFGARSTLLTLPKDCKLIDWAEPFDESEEVFPAKHKNTDTWDITISRLNDAKSAPFIFPGYKAFPTPLVLTATLIVANYYDPSTKLPTVVTEENKAMFALADNFTRKMNGGYEGKSLYQLDDLVKLVAGSVAEKPTEQSWLRSYQHVQALMLTMSDEFERPVDSWTFDGNNSLQNDIVIEMIKTFVAVLLHPPSAAMQAIVDKDAKFLRKHLKAGAFRQFFEFVEDDCKELPEYMAFLKAGDDDDDDASMAADELKSGDGSP
jgi:hypothetical protein